MEPQIPKSWSTTSANAKPCQPARRLALLVLSSRESIRIFGFLALSFSVAQLVLLGHPALTPPPHLANLTAAPNFATTTYADRIIVSERSRLVYCPVPKAGNTNWKYLIRKWEGLPDYSDVSRAHLPSLSGLRYLSDYSPREAAAILSDGRYFKFAFVRDPFARALSAYMDKFRNADPHYVAAEYRVFLAALLGWRAAKSVDVRYAPRPSFKQFVEALVPASRKEMNAHWRPQTLLCGFGEMRYDFVGRMERLTEDAEEVFRRLNRTGERFPTHQDIGFPPSGASHELAKEVYTPELRRHVRDIYKDDFRVLGYPTD